MTEPTDYERQIAADLRRTADEALRTADGIAPAAYREPEPPTFTRSQIADRDFYVRHRDEIMEAARHGRIRDDPPARRTRVEYPDDPHTGMRQVGPGIYQSSPRKDR